MAYIAVGLIWYSFCRLLFCVLFLVCAPETEKRMNCKLSEETLGQRIKAQRMRLKMTQDGLAEAMCIPKSIISAYENDKVDIKGSILMGLSEYLHTIPNYLLGYEKKEEQNLMEESIASVLGNIQDEKVKELLFKQIQLAGQVMGK